MELSTQVEYLNRKQAADILDVAERTVLDWAKKKKYGLGSADGVDPDTHQPCVLLVAGDVERIRHERGTKRRVVAEPVKPRERLLEAGQAGVAISGRPWLNLDQASEESGLSRKLLLELILSGELPARQDHVLKDRWRVHRADLEALRGVQVEIAKGAGA